MKTIYEIAKKEDGKEIRNLILDNFEEIERYISASLQWYGVYEEDIHQDKNGYYFVYRVEETIQGFVKMTLSTKYLTVENVFITRGWRNKGYAAKLIQFGINTLTNYYGPRVFTRALTVENQPAERLFEKLGFENKGTYKDFVYTSGKWRDQTLWMIKNNL